MATVTQTAADYRTDLANLDVQAANQMAKAYTGVVKPALEQSLVGVQAVLEEQHAAGLEPSPYYVMQEERYQTLIQQATGQAAVYAGVTAKTGATSVGQAVQLGQQSAVDLSVAAAGPGPSLTGAFASLPRGALENLVGAMGSEGVKKALANYPDTAASTIQTALVASMANGRTPKQVRRDLAGSLESRMVSKAAMLIRDQQYQAYRETNRQTFEKNKHLMDGWIWHADLRQGTCSVCWAMHGSLHPVDESMASHVACRCTVVPKTKSWEELGYSGIDDMRPVIVPGESIFAGLSDRDQRRILGPTKYDAYKSGLINLQSLVGITTSSLYGPGRRELSLDAATARGPQNPPIFAFDRPAELPLAIREMTPDLARAAVAVLNSQNAIASMDYLSDAADVATGDIVGAISERVLTDPRWATEGPGILAQLRAEYPDIDTDQGLLERKQSDLIASWGATSGDADPFSIAMQQAAALEFNLTNAGLPYDDADIESATADFGDQASLLQILLRAQYDATQARFVEAGITELTVYRGIGWEGDSEIPDWATQVEAGDVAAVDYNAAAMSSWSTRYDVAAEFAAGDTTFVLNAQMPVQSILSTVFTGLGTGYEHEVVVLANQGQMQARTPPDAYTAYVEAVGQDRADAALNGEEEWDNEEAWDEEEEVEEQAAAFGFEAAFDFAENDAAIAFIEDGLDPEEGYTGDQAETVKAGIQEELGRRLAADPLAVEIAIGLGVSPTADMANVLGLQAAKIVSLWAGTSGDANPEAVAVQLAARQEFGLENTSSWWGPDVEATAMQTQAGNIPFNQRVLRAQYEYTQEQLEVSGMEYVSLVRGAAWHYLPNTDPIALKPPDWVEQWTAEEQAGEDPRTKNLPIQLQPISSYSAMQDTAEEFAHTLPISEAIAAGEVHASFLFKTRVHRSQILSTARTGNGCLNEFEYVVLGAQGEQRVEAQVVGYREQ